MRSTDLPPDVFVALDAAVGGQLVRRERWCIEHGVDLHVEIEHVPPGLVVIAAIALASEDTVINWWSWRTWDDWPSRARSGCPAREAKPSRCDLRQSSLLRDRARPES